MIKIEKDIEGVFLQLSIEPEGGLSDSVAWEVSPELEDLLLKELKAALGGEFADHFDPTIKKAIDMIESCVY